MRNTVLATTLLFASACGNAGGTSIEASTPLVIAEGQAPVTYGHNRHALAEPINPSRPAGGRAHKCILSDS